MPEPSRCRSIVYVRLKCCRWLILRADSPSHTLGLLHLWWHQTQTGAVEQEQFLGNSDKQISFCVADWSGISLPQTRDCTSPTSRVKASSTIRGGELTGTVWPH